MSPTPYAADLVVPIAWGVVGLLLVALVVALLRGRRAAASAPEADGAGPAGPAGAAPVPTADLTTPATTAATTSTTPVTSPEEPTTRDVTPAGTRPTDTGALTTPGATPGATPVATPAAAPTAWDQGQPAPAPTTAEPAPDVREMRVLRRQVDVLTRTLAEWEQVRATEEPGPTAPSAPETAATPATPAPGPVPRPSLPGAAYLDLSRRLAERGDLEGAVLAQWACDLEVLRGPLAAHEGDLATAVAAVEGDDPVAVLRGCREAALALVAVAGPVRTLLAPLDHLAQAASADPATRATSAGFPAELVDLAPEADRPALSALVAGRRAQP